MARITTVLNQKGGVGKTTDAHALATGLNDRGFKALVIDAAPPGDISYTMPGEPDQAVWYESLQGLRPPAEDTQHPQQGDQLPSTLDISDHA